MYGQGTRRSRLHIAKGWRNQTAQLPTHVFNPATQAVGLSDFTPHDLRDTAASIAIIAGANVKQVQNMLGHASAAMTLDVYAGLFEDDLTALADRIDNAAADNLRTAAAVVVFHQCDRPADAKIP